MNIFKLIDQRLSFVEGLVDTKCNDFDYTEIALEGNSADAGIIQTKGKLNWSQSSAVLIREVVLSEWHIAGIFDLSALLSPFSSIQCYFYYLTREKPEKVVFSIYESDMCYTGRFKSKDDLTEVIKNRQITEEYKSYLDAINLVINEDNLKLIDTKLGDHFFERPYEMLNLDHLSIDYYKPESIENRKKLEEENTKTLQELADIITPKTIKGRKGKFAKNLKTIEESDSYREGNATDVLVQPNDIIVPKLNYSELVLVSDNFQGEVCALNNWYIIRPKSDEITVEYLFLFMISDTAQKYFEQFSRSAVLSKILTKKDLFQLPIIIPNKQVLKRASSIYESLYLTKQPSRIEIINEQLFNTEVPEQAVQKELIEELLARIKSSKLELIQEIIKDDLNEVDKCFQVEAFKSVVVLSGSILEAILLDWLSEVSKVNYLTSKETIDLFNVIEKLNQEKYLSAYLKDAAHKIRQQRNMVHPKLYMKSKDQLNKQVASEVLTDLRKILSKRLGEYKN